ncbi:MAG: hypothetical protein J6386_18040 [Candidatus Synoicihabitans palmerolidicus]|nr:hypothetical protein [Candidatus Synoicihabitans palmerolidicus]
MFRSSDGWKVQIFQKQLLTWCGILLISSYFGAGLLLFLKDRYRHDLEGISLADRIYPPRWENYNRARGDAYIVQAPLSLEKGLFAKAFHQVRAGLARASGNLIGRNVLADMYLASGRIDLAQTVLVTGLKFHSGSKDYLQRTFSFLFKRQQDTQIIQLANALLPKIPPRFQ